MILGKWIILFGSMKAHNELESIISGVSSPHFDLGSEEETMVLLLRFQTFILQVTEFSKD